MKTLDIQRFGLLKVVEFRRNIPEPQLGSPVSLSLECPLAGRWAAGLVVDGLHQRAHISDRIGDAGAMTAEQ